jgi:hypothetical protein
LAKEEYANGEEKISSLSEEEVSAHLVFVQEQKVNHPVVKAHHGKWKELIEWKEGNQYSEWNEQAQTLKPVELRLRKKRVVINLLKPLGEAIEGKISLAYQMAGMPNSDELVDIEASNVATKLISYNDRINEVESLMEDMKTDMIDTGNACMIWTYEKDYYADLMAVQADGTVKSKKDKVGEVVCHVPSIFNVRPDPTAKTRRQMRWFIEFAEVERSLILEAFPKISKEDLEGPKEEQQQGQEGAGPTKYAGMNESNEEKSQNEQTEIVAWYWEKKCSDHPKGRLIISTAKCILHEGANPALGEIPAFFFRYKKSSKSFWGTGPFHHVQGIQREFNRTVSIISEHIEGWRAKMLIPEGSLTRQGAFTMDSFELLEYDPTRGKPEPAMMPELSAQVLLWKDFLMGALNQVANVHEVSYSQLPKYASRAPASLFSMMLEQENLKIDPMLKHINKIIRDMGSFRLRLMDKYYKQERLVKVIGKNGSASIAYFKGADLAGNFDVSMEIGVSMKQSRIVQQRLLLELRQMNIITDNNKILKMLDDNAIAEGLREDLVDENRAKRENQAFINDTWKKGREEGGVFLYAHDDDDVHLNHHTDLAKTEEAQRWPTEQWNGLQNHILLHMQKKQIAGMTSMAAENSADPNKAAGAGSPGMTPAPTMAEGAQAEPAVAQERAATAI